MADSSKTEQATAKRQEKAREQGQVARSRELPSVLAVAGAVATLTFVSQGALAHWTTFYRMILDSAATQDLDWNGPVIFWSAVEVLRWVVPVMVVSLVVSLSAGLGQGGINFAPAALALKFERFNPVSKIGQIFSITGVEQSLQIFAPVCGYCVACRRHHCFELGLDGEGVVAATPRAFYP